MLNRTVIVDCVLDNDIQQSDGVFRGAIHSPVDDVERYENGWKESAGQLVDMAGRSAAFRIAVTRLLQTFDDRGHERGRR